MVTHTFFESFLNIYDLWMLQKEIDTLGVGIMMMSTKLIYVYVQTCHQKLPPL